ncbi:MAG: L-histidine N(alpha)-methyltransferase [Prolixibacteraceae bacterium]|jgi:L-histidine N-alpha-methyltransferase|nr:L-histidine N(alpha)-methyltransferase [Prolixibacteraceae bacterium]
MEQQTILSELATDTFRGLSANQKFLLSKYFYDDEGSRIFQDIMQMPEYYLTDCEFEIFTIHKEQITLAFREGVQSFDLIELGSGDGLKTKILLQHLVEKLINFHYIPIDISHQANTELVKSLKLELPLLSVKAKTGDYFREVKKLNGYSGLRKVILFLGANIGNFSDEEILLFFGQLSTLCHKGDKVLIGFDMKKSPDVIMKAYSDPHGHTRKFNLNHLIRLNRELDANFNLDQFEQHTEYNPLNGAVKSFLVSKREQIVHIGALEQSFHFKQWEPIFMELSRKFDLETIESIAENHGFKVEKQFFDSRNYFVDSLWVKK